MSNYWKCIRGSVLAFTIACLLPCIAVFADEPIKYSAQDSDGDVTILRNGQPVAEYLKFSVSKPVFAALRGPRGEQLTRNYPLGEALPTEKQDHIHHRSMWFTHGEVNDVDFWAEGPNHGKIVQTGIDVTSDDKSVTLKTQNEWVDSNGKKHLTDRRMFMFHDVRGMRAIDCVIELIASAGPVVFGDTKEGSFGIRVAGTMKVDSKLGGRIVSSRGLTDNDAWGQPAEWVGYCGPVEGETSGIAILNHPSSFGYPTRWHVRSYGLFAANPFGVHHFIGGKRRDGVRLENGESLVLKYRVLLHAGTTADADIASAWDEYSNLEIVLEPSE